MNIQNGRHYDVIIKNHWFRQKYNFVNNAWIHMEFKLVIVQVKAIIFHLCWFWYIQNGRRYDVITENHGNGRSTLNKKDRDLQVVLECRYWGGKSYAFYGIEISWAVVKIWPLPWIIYTYNSKVTTKMQVSFLHC